MDLRRLQVNTKTNGWIEIVNSLGIDVGKKKCRAALKDERGYRILHQWQRGNPLPLFEVRLIIENVQQYQNQQLICG
jgi:hypothetical protein